MKGVQCYELFGGIALKIHTFSFFIIQLSDFFVFDLKFLSGVSKLMQKLVLHINKIVIF